MKKILITIIAILTVTAGFSQVALRKSSLSSGGGSASSGNLYMAYAVGEIGVQEATSGNIHLSEGFIGPDIITIVGVEDYAQLQGVNVYPNPVQSYVNIELPENNNYEVHLFDITGKELMNKSIEDTDNAQYNLSSLPSGIYLMTVIDRKNKQFVTIKLQKL